MTLKQAHKECKAIWKWLSENSDLSLNSKTNKLFAMEKLNIQGQQYKHLCPYCEYDKNINKPKWKICMDCPIHKKYDFWCGPIGYENWHFGCTRENAKNFYNKIKDL